MTVSEKKPTPSHGDEIDLFGLFRALWVGKWLIGGITTAAAVVSVVVVLMLPDIYRAEALLAPNHKERAGGLSALAAQYSGLASLAGINIGGSESIDNTMLSLEVLKSREFVSQFIKRHDILVPLMAAAGWDPVSGELHIDSDKYDVESGEWVRKVRPPRTAIPSMQEAHEEFTDILSVFQDKKTGFVKIAVEHYSPVVAKQWVDWLVEDINLAIMDRDVEEAERAIEYLNEQITNTALAGLQNVFFRLIEEQTKTILLAKVSSEYVLQTLDPAVPPEEKVRPKRALIVVLALFLGGLVGVVLQLVLYRANDYSRQG